MGLQVNRIQQQAQRVVQSFTWGDVVWHVWGNQQQAAPLVLVHGGSGSWTHWVHNVTHLAQERPVWAMDIPGFGDSSLPHSVYDADGLVPYMAEILRSTFPLQAVAVMGFSFGGMTAGLLAAEHPELIRQLILVGVPGLGLFGKELPMRGMHPSMDEAAQRQVHRHNLATMMLVDPAIVTNEVIDLQIANVTRDRLRRRRIARTDVLVQVQARWRCPVHGIWGSQDALYKNRMMDVPKALTRLNSFDVVSDAGHWVMFENPQEFHRVVDPLLNSATPTT